MRGANSETQRERTKEEERKISEGGVGSETFDCVNTSNSSVWTK